MKIFSLFAALCITLTSQTLYGQFKTVYIGINGLTCSQCSKTVEKKIRQLSFVSDVKMDLQQTEARITLNSGWKTDIADIARAVTDAGFAVRYLDADFDMDHTTLQGSCMYYMSDGYAFTPTPKSRPRGVVRLTFLGKKYMPKNEFKKIQSSLHNNCSATGEAYYVTMKE